MGRTVIKSNRRFWAWTSLGLGAMALLLLSSIVRDPGNATGLIFGAFLGVGLLASVRNAFASRIEFSFDTAGFTVGDGRRFVAWSDVGRVRVCHSGSGHELVLHIKPGTTPLRRRPIMTNATNPDEISVALDHLSMPWQDIVRDVQAATGTPITADSTGPFGLGSRPISPE